MHRQIKIRIKIIIIWIRRERNRRRRFFIIIILLTNGSMAVLFFIAVSNFCGLHKLVCSYEMRLSHHMKDLTRNWTEAWLSVVHLWVYIVHPILSSYRAHNSTKICSYQTFYISSILLLIFPRRSIVSFETNAVELVAMQPVHEMQSD